MIVLVTVFVLPQNYLKILSKLSEGSLMIVLVTVFNSSENYLEIIGKLSGGSLMIVLVTVFQLVTKLPSPQPEPPKTGCF